MTILKLKIPGIKVEYEGSEKLPENRALHLLEAMKKSNNADVKKNLLELNRSLEQNLAALDGHVSSMSKLRKELAHRIKEVNKKSMRFLEKVETSGEQPGWLCKVVGCHQGNARDANVFQFAVSSTPEPDATRKPLVHRRVEHHEDKA